MRIQFKKSVAVLVVIIQTLHLPAQTTKKTEENTKALGAHCISLGLLAPIGNFSSTHIGGMMIEYSPGSHITKLSKAPHFAFTYNGGLSYYLGKKETVSSYPYKYPGYFFIQAFAGAWYNPSKNIDLRLTAGPALGIYNGTTRFNIGAQLQGTYYFDESRFNISPLIMLMKESGADPLWAIGAKVGFNF